MIKKKDLENELKKYSKNSCFISASEVGRFVGDSNTYRVRSTYLSNLSRLNGTLYFIPEVAEEFLKRVK